MSAISLETETNGIHYDKNLKEVLQAKAFQLKIY
jgi:hypothetical protein